MLKLENGMVLFQPCPLICARKLIALSQAPSTCWEGLGDVHAHFLKKTSLFPGGLPSFLVHMCIENILGRGSLAGNNVHY